MADRSKPAAQPDHAQSPEEPNVDAAQEPLTAPSDPAAPERTPTQYVPFA